MTPEELARYLQSTKQRMDDALVREKTAELELEDARTLRLRHEGEVAILTALLQQMARVAQAAEKEEGDG